MSQVPSPPPSPLFVGIDVSKETLDVYAADTPGLPRAVANTPAGIVTLKQALLAQRIALIVIESTGRYHRRVACMLLDAGLPVALVNPRQVRDFARARGILAKTDRLDARVLADFARAIRPPLAARPSDKQLELDELVTRRRQVLAMRTQELNHAEMLADRQLARTIKSHLRMLDKQLDELDRRIALLIESDDHWNNAHQILTSVPGVGDRTSTTLIAEMPELGKLNRQQAGALAGVAPMAYESGAFSGKRAIAGGRPAVRTSLYMASLSATRHNPAIKRFADRLKASGKPFKVVMVACMHKLLLLLNALIKNNIRWEQSNAAKIA